MQIHVQTPVAELLIDPFAGGSDLLPADHGPFSALAQGADWRGKLERLDALLATLPQTYMPVTHRFSRGVYARELFIPAGTVLTGRIHKYSQINILLRGDMGALGVAEAARVRLSKESPDCFVIAG